MLEFVAWKVSRGLKKLLSYHVMHPLRWSYRYSFLCILRDPQALRIIVRWDLEFLNYNLLENRQKFQKIQGQYWLTGTMIKEMFKTFEGVRLRQSWCDLRIKNLVMIIPRPYSLPKIQKRSIHDSSNTQQLSFLLDSSKWESFWLSTSNDWIRKSKFH